MAKKKVTKKVEGPSNSVEPEAVVGRLCHGCGGIIVTDAAGMEAHSQKHAKGKKKSNG